MHRISLIVIVLGLTIGLIASGFAFVPPEETPEETAQEAGISMEKAPPSKQAEAKWETFVAEHGDRWEVLWNPVTKTPHRTFGKGIQIADRVTDSNAASLAQGFIESNADFLGIDVERLRLVRSDRHGVRWYSDFQQIYNGLDVVGGRVHVRLNEAGKVTVFGSDFYPDLSIPTVPSISEEDAILKAKGDSEFDPRTDETLSSRLVVLPVARGDRADYHLAYEIRVRIESTPAIWRTYLDADDGTILRKENEIRYDAIYGTVSGDIKAMCITDPDSEEPFADHYVTITGYGQATTDATGYYSKEAGSGGLREVTAQLKGLWCVVTNYSGSNASYADSVAPGSQKDIKWDSSNSIASERNAYHHMVVVHSKIKEIDPSYTDMDRQTPVRVNLPDYCNAYWDGNGITIGAGTGSCQDLAMFCDVIYHEYGHGITDFLYRPYSPSGAMHEAFSDYLACTITNESYIGEGVLGPGSYFRNLDNTLRYPDDLTGEVHDDGRILAGALWDLRGLLSPDIGLADSLFHYSRYGLSDNFIDYYYDVLETDDDDSDLSNGTPHSYEINVAFGNNHGIGPGAYIDIAHYPVKDSEDSTATYPVVVTIESSIIVDPDSVLLHYSTGAGFTQSPMLPTANPGEYSTTIPEQGWGATVDYYIYARAQGHDQVQTHPEGAPGNLHTFSVGADTEAPVITHTPMPDQPDAGWPSTVAATVYDNLGLASVMLEYNKNGVPQTPIPMTNTPGTDDFEAAFGCSASSGDYIEYRIVATDASAGSYVTSDPSTDYHVFGVSEADHYIFESGAEGWTHWTDGTWYDEWHLSTQRNHTSGGSTSWKCGSTSSGDYGAHLKALLETPVIYIEDDARLTFWHWIDAETYEPLDGSGIAWDGAAVSFVDSAGVATPIDPVGGYPYNIIVGAESPFPDEKPVFSGHHDWKMEEFDLSGYTGFCQIRFKFGSDNYVAGEGWYIDDAMIWSGGVLAGIDLCPGDCIETEDVPVRFNLGRPLPNPSAGSMRISYAVPSPASRVSIKVFDIRGRLATDLVDEMKLPGRYVASWDGKDSQGRMMAPGVYFVRMQSRSFDTASKLILFR